MTNPLKLKPPKKVNAFIAYKCRDYSVRIEFKEEFYDDETELMIKRIGMHIERQLKKNRARARDALVPHRKSIT